MFWSAKGFSENDLALGCHGLEHIRPGPDGVLHERIVARQELLVSRTVLGDDLEAELGQGVQDGALQREPHGGIVHLLDGVDELVPHLERGDRPGMHHDLVGEDHVIGGEGFGRLILLRVPGHVLPKEEGVGPAVLGCLPSLRELGYDLLLLVDPHKSVEEELGDAERDHLIARDGVECGRPAVLTIAQGAAVGLAVLLGGGVYGARHDNDRHQHHHDHVFHRSLLVLLRIADCRLRNADRKPK
jgi:hypothetical protein